MRIHQVVIYALSVCLPLGTLAQTTPGDSLPVAPSAQPGITIPLQASAAVPETDPSPKQARPERKGQYAPGGYGPSALLYTGHFGVKAGAQLTSAPITGVSPSIEKRDLDIHLGVLYRYRFSKFVIQPELLYQIKGGNYQRLQIGSSNRATIENNFNYISLPIMLGYIPVEGLTIQAGPEFSWRIETTNGPQSSRDAGIALGVHYDFLDMLDKFSLNIRYVYGLTKIPETVNSTLQNRAFQVGVVYNFYKK
ncbi:hypothetical protein FAES_1165 [Fibrella aestuarina BUZ 2]|uniref:Outer membrane protein beta-barrel domain-containing protein n=1 Tax=Fibrella aestuarina BUZ 2 TaxID=1166018 RepID=I0K4X2_9BACT|nr:porin family protein [Fibrella aestuarina]CCG99175.1 hypothetical protein FAES_1165 [Fibrella aestuarina BUZ 2]